MKGHVRPLNQTLGGNWPPRFEARWHDVDELRMKIQAKIDGPRSSFGHIKRLSDIFKTKIDNEITNFSKLLEMCNKAEELKIEFDLKDKLRYIISDIILYGSTK